MVDRKPDPLLRYIRKLTEVEWNSHLSDQELLHHFAANRDQAAFTALVRRHGDLVLRVCRRVLHQSPDAEDVFQATFMVLSRKAGSRRWQESVGRWLCKVAYRLALEAKAAAARRHVCETQVRPAANVRSSTSLQDLEAVLDEELARLPESLRFPLILCCLEGQTRSQVAQQLGYSEATIGRRINQAREVLRSRLTRRGIALSTVLLAVELANGSAAAGMSVLLVAPTVRAAVAFAARQGGLEAGTSTQAISWAEGILHAMVLTKVKLGAALLAATLMAGTMSALVCQGGMGTVSRKTSPISQPATGKILAPSSQKTVSVDGYGDPLPEGAVARLGTVRWRHGQYIPYLAFLPDGKSVLSASQDQTARVWDVVTGRELRQFGVGRSLIFALSVNGKVFAASGAGAEVHLYEVVTGKKIQQIQGPLHGVGALTFTADGQFLAAAEANGAMHVWETATGKELHQFHAGASTKLPCTLAFAADGTKLFWAARAEDDKQPPVIQIWDMATGKKLSQVNLVGNPLNNFRTTDLELSPNGKVLAWGAEESIRLSHAATGQEIHRLEIKPDMTPAGLTFSPDGQVLAVRDEMNQIVELWDTATGKKRWRNGERIQSFRRIIDRTPGKALAFSPDNKILVVGGGHNTIRLLDVATGQEIHALGGHQAAVSMVRFGPDGKTLLTYGEDNTTRQWHVPTGKELRQIQSMDGKTSAPVLSRDGRIAAALEKDAEAIRIWDTTTGKMIRHMRVNGISLFVLSPDGQRIAWHTGNFAMFGGNQLQRVHKTLLFDVAAEKTDHLTANNESFSATSLVFSPDAQILAFLSKDAEGHAALRLWDIATGSLWRHLEVLDKRSIHAVAFTPDARSVALDVGDGMVCVGEVASGKERCRLKKKQPPLLRGNHEVGSVSRISFATQSVSSHLAFSSDGKVLAQGHTDGTITVWDVVAGKELFVLRGHQGAIRSLDFAPDGKTLASGSVDTTALIWDITPWTQSRHVAVPDLSERDLEARWSNLLSSDASQVFQAVLALAAVPNQAVPFLRKHLRPVGAIDVKWIQQLITDLDNQSFAVRKRASAALEQEGEAAIPIVQQALQNERAPETRKRLQHILDKLSRWNISGERLRQLRAVEALERMGTPEAKQLLQVLAQGLPGAMLTREAAATLKRLGR